MARPRKNAAPKTEAQPAEYDYSEGDEMYAKVMSQGAVAPQVSEEVFQAEDTLINVPAPVAVASTIFLVEGKVRLDQEGSAPIFSDQRRIVNAADVDEAIQKFMNYYARMSNPSQRYSVVSAAASETIL